MELEHGMNLVSMVEIQTLLANLKWSPLKPVIPFVEVKKVIVLRSDLGIVVEYPETVIAQAIESEVK